MPSKKISARLVKEEPPVSFYADLVEKGIVEVKHNAKGGLVVTQGTQYLKMKERRPFPGIMKLVFVFCGILTAYTLCRLVTEPMPCMCRNVACATSGMHFLRVLRCILSLH